jgi:hypothetical protein
VAKARSRRQRLSGLSGLSTSALSLCETKVIVVITVVVVVVISTGASFRSEISGRGHEVSPSQESAIVLSARANSSISPNSALMSRSNRTTSSSNFQLVINNALKEYEKRTKQDLLAHPLASQLQACDSPTAILNVLLQQVQGLDEARRNDDRWTKWLDPTVNILYTLCDTFGDGVGLVSLKT